MRLWSLHPGYLDRMGLLACWREGLLAQKVLQGKTRGYKNHPQLLRFKKTRNPSGAVSAYLGEILKEAERRGYNFNSALLVPPAVSVQIQVSSGQLFLEFNLLLDKLKERSPSDYRRLKGVQEIKPNPIFQVCNGPAEGWEKQKI